MVVYLVCIAGEKNVPPQNTPLQHKDYFEQKILEDIDVGRAL